MKLSSLSVLLLIFICVSIVASKTPCPDKLSGIVRWSAWGSAPTTAGASATIAAGQVILLDVSPPRLDHIDVYGTLVIDPKVPTIDFTFASLYVRNGGKLYMGSEECPLSNKVTITLVGSPLPGTDPSGVGTKVLGVLNGGLLEIHGAPRKPVWTVLSKSTQFGDTQITLDENVDWAVGESIVVATTDFEQFDDNPSYPPTQNEVVVITSRPRDNVVAFDTPLKYVHYGKVWSANGDDIDMRAEVGLLTRNIVIKGDVGNTTSAGALEARWGGHVMIRDGGMARIEYAEVTLMGQKGEFGRYPLHFHNSSTQPNSYLRGNSIHDTFQRCIVVHSTFNLRIIDNLAYRGVGHCFFIEDGNEEQNVFEHNLGIKALVGTLLHSDAEPAMFWITNPLNHFYSNVAVGGKMGFWFAMPQHPLALSDAMRSTLLRNKPNGDFLGNKAHSANFGLFIDRGLANAKPGDANDLTSYNPVNLTSALDLAAKMGKPVDLTTLDEYSVTVYGFRQPAVFINFIAFKNVEFGLWGRGSFMWVYGAKLADNTVGCAWPGNANLMQNIVMVGETDNVGTPNIQVGKYANYWGDEEGRTRPSKYFIQQPVVGYSSYDAGGGDLVININFHNYNDFTFSKGSNAGKVRKTGAITGLSGPNVIHPKNRIFRAKFYNVDNRVYVREYYPWEPQLDVTDDAVKGIVWVDADGSILAGLPEAGCGKQIVGAGPLVRTAGCVAKPAWNAYICPANSNAHRAFSIYQETTVLSQGHNESTFRLQNDLHIQRLSDAASLDVEADIRDQGAQYSAKYSYGTTLVMNNAYYVTLGNANTFLSTFRVQMFDVPKGETIRFAFPVPNGAAVAVKTGGYNGDQNPAVQVNSYSQLAINSYYYDSAAGIVWVHMESASTSYDYYYNIPVLSSAVAFSISVTGCGDTCSYSPKSTPSGAAPSGKPFNLCVSSGATIGSVKSYSQKSSDVLTIFDDAFASPFSISKECNISTDMAYKGTSSLKCTLGTYGYTSFARNWQSQGTPVPITKYTHLQVSVRVAPGFGSINMIAGVFNQSYNSDLPAVDMWNPDHTDSAGPMDDSRWTVVTIPLNEIAIPNLNLWGLFFANRYPRPVIVYVDNIQLVSLSESSKPIKAFPADPAKPLLVGPGPVLEADQIYGSSASHVSLPMGTLVFVVVVTSLLCIM